MQPLLQELDHGLEDDVDAFESGQVTLHLFHFHGHELSCGAGPAVVPNQQAKQGEVAKDDADQLAQNMIVIQRPNKWNKQWSDNRKYHPNRTCMAVIETEYQLRVKELLTSYGYA
ncbi:hypothetical protein BGZ74_011153 [Mortierella antarctica]|nr:hypothetical protein BGZ74_011153 [Mortierella antarctica]